MGKRRRSFLKGSTKEGSTEKDGSPKSSGTHHAPDFAQLVVTQRTVKKMAITKGELISPLLAKRAARRGTIIKKKKPEGLAMARLPEGGGA